MIATKRSWKILLGAVFGGITLGVTARLWMRWISTEPEFSWSGSIFIVIAFTIFTTSQALVYVLRRRVKSKKLNAVVRIGGAIFSLTIFSGAGALMFPTVFLVSIGLWQKRLDKRIRYVLLALSLLIPIQQIMDFWFGLRLESDNSRKIATFHIDLQHSNRAFETYYHPISRSR